MELPSKKAANGITQACEIKFAKSTQRRFEISRCCLIYLLLLFCEQFTVSSSSENKICPDRQKAKLYAEGIVKCSIFHHIGIYWFMGTDEIHGNNAFIEKVNGVVDGDGYVSGEFDVLRDGSLKIFNVTHLHEGSFRVKVVDSQNSIQSFIIHLLVYDTERCPGIQEVQLHTKGIVMCNVVHHSEQVFWYNKAHGIDGGAAFIQMVDGEVQGVGYDSGEFDILHDGSLVINNVSRNHQGLFRVKTVDSRWMIHSHDVQLLVNDSYTPSTILIDACTDNPPCDVFLTRSKNISCRIAVTHPKMQLTMVCISENVILAKIVKETIEEDGISYTTVTGEVMMRHNSCGESGFVLCKAVGTGQEALISDVHINVTNGNQTCSPGSSEKDPNDTDTEIAQQPGLPNTHILRYTPIMILGLLPVIFLIVRKRKAQQDQRQSVITHENGISYV